jgi:hypothetical protein
MRLDSKFLWFLVPALFALAPFACGSDEADDDGNDGTGGEAPTSSSTGISTVSSSSTGFGPQSSSSGSTAECRGVFEPNDCVTCLEENCCQEIEDGGGEVTDALVTCGEAAECPCDFGGGLALPEPECGAGAATPSMGACVTVADPVACNPVSSTECGGAGSACDVNNTGFECYDSGNDHNVCEECGANGDYCKQGMTCIGKCYKYCCSDADCAPGVCLIEVDGEPIFGANAAPTLGVCVEAGQGGAGGAGGAGGGATGGGGAGGAGGTGGA